MSIYPYYAAILAICTVLLTAPLLLGSYVVLQRSGGLVQGLWLTLLLLLLVFTVGVGLLGLYLLVVPVSVSVP